MSLICISTKIDIFTKPNHDLREIARATAFKN